MLKNVRVRLLISYLGLIVLTLAIAGSTFHHILVAFGQQQAEASLTTKAADLETYLHEHGTKGDKLGDQIASYFKSSSHADGIHLVVINAKGSPVFDPQNQANSELVANALGKHSTQNFLWTSGDGVANRWLHLSFPLEGVERNRAYADLSLSLTDGLRAQHDLYSSLLYLAIILVVAALLLSDLMLRQVLGPVREIQRVANRLASGDLGERLQGMGGGELGQLGDTINKLSDEIQRNIVAVVGEKNKMDAILSSLVDGVVTLDRTGAITFINQTASRILQDVQQDRGTAGSTAQASSWLGSNLMELLKPAPLQELHDQCVSLGGAISREMNFGERDFTVFAIPLGNSAQSDSLILLRDVTSLKQLETARNQFLGNVSHELKTPLTIVKGFVVTLQKTEGLTAEMTRYLDFIDRETDRLARLVDDLLNLARLRSKRTQMNFSFCEPTELLRDCYKQLQPQAAKYDTTLALHCPDNLPVLLADNDRFKEIVINLVDNAFKYTPPKGRVELSGEATEEYLVVRIRDHGPGIPADEIPFLFERFFRGTDKAGRKSGGTGIGLAIVKEIVDMHRGHITVESIAGEGTTFVVSLPLRQGSRKTDKSGQETAERT
jgi:two-component system phosphate regulon sensor histidine kinase PhoR